MGKLKYTPNRNGVRELAQSDGVGNACYQAGKAVEAAARAVPLPSASARQATSYRNSFGTERADVTMATTGEKRAGAIVYNDHRLERIFGGKSRALYSAIQAIDGMEIT
ncbi:hypothetical protein DFO66_103385 [Brevibacterium sanguinis]|uniref:Uncharacterized protein n=2 Tax=Brevibacterium TaxID=1696 RepID=A0A366IKX7_9MICO|nr:MULTISPECIES: hypothetical protein [Brevibacterium]RBP66435.1 hypothetical protein DFO66_103385 [Brevibacterium sanguinis]RBP73087.1 hypothetical protein DFO65_103385 [Brevibacterium celere]